MADRGDPCHGRFRRRLRGRPRRSRRHLRSDLQPGDILPPHSLFEIADELGRAPDTDLLYTDEDEIDAAGQRAAPRLKTGWDSDLLLAFDCIGGTALYRRDLLQRIGPPRGTHAAAVLYDLALRATDAMLPDRIRHLPRVLLHRPAGSAAAVNEELPQPHSGSSAHWQK